ncbi:MAG: hypothetical protein Q9213_008373 [Squamulea squamosa]
MAPLKIAIIGAGIGGPAAAIALAQKGHKVTLYERSTTGSEVGYAFRITPNSDLCLKHLGVDTIAGGAVASQSVCLMNAEGKVLHKITENANDQPGKGGTSVFAYRPQLHQQLMDVASNMGVDIRLGVKAKLVDVDNTRIMLEDGSELSVDLIVAADGVHSIVRPHVIDTSKYFPTPSTGHNAFRFMVTRLAAEKDDIVSAAISESRMLSWFGHDRRILVYPVDYDRQFNITCTHPQEFSDTEVTGNDPESIAYNQKASFDAVLEIYKNFPPAVIRLFHLADPNGFRIWKLQDMDEIPSWSRNGIVLLGDACHPVSPFGFSGASMAIEDAVTLGELLPETVAVGDISAQLKLYEEIRKPRVGRVRDTARMIAGGMDSREFMGPYLTFLGEHDAVSFAREALAKHLEAKA